MKTTKRNKCIVSIMMLVSIIGSAQTVNTGDLFITPGTIVSTIEALDNTTTAELTNDGELYLYGHFNNDGLVTFTPDGNTGMTRMRGLAGHQDISGSVPMMLNNVEFNNGNVQPAFHLSNEIRISGEAAFEKGIVDDDNYSGLVVFENTGKHTNVKNESHVDGEVRKNGNNAFQFPIGDGGFYRYARISAPNQMSDAFTGKYFLEDSNTLYSHNSKEGLIEIIDNAEYWTIDKNAGTDNVFLTLSWDEDTTPYFINTTPYDEIHIVRWDDTQKKWMDEGGASDSNTKEVSMLVNPMHAYGVFTLARVKGALSDIVVYNALSPNGDGQNDYFKIDGIEKYKNNNVEIFNRWGVKVFETSAYDTSGNTFKGFSEGRATINKGEKLPSGTYFYIINIESNIGGKDFKKAGYLFIND